MLVLGAGISNTTFPFQMSILILRLHYQALCSTRYDEFSFVCLNILNRTCCMPSTCITTRLYIHVSGKKYASASASRERNLFQKSSFSHRNVLIIHFLCKQTNKATTTKNFYFSPSVHVFFCFNMVAITVVSATALSINHLLRMNPGLTPSENIGTRTYIFLSLLNHKGTRWTMNCAMHLWPEHCLPQMKAES